MLSVALTPPPISQSNRPGSGAAAGEDEGKQQQGRHGRCTDHVWHEPGLYPVIKLAVSKTQSDRINLKLLWCVNGVGCLGAVEELRASGMAGDRYEVCGSVQLFDGGEIDCVYSLLFMTQEIYE